MTEAGEGGSVEEGKKNEAGGREVKGLVVK